MNCCRYHLRFHVSDRKHTQNDVPANVTVMVREITHEAIINSGSIRIAGITDEDFIRIWEYRVRPLIQYIELIINNNNNSLSSSLVNGRFIQAI